MIGMEMCQHHVAHFSGGNPENSKLGTNLFAGMDGKAY